MIICCHVLSSACWLLLSAGWLRVTRHVHPQRVILCRGTPERPPQLPSQALRLQLCGQARRQDSTPAGKGGPVTPVKSLGWNSTTPIGGG
jgi:hypothetical protein